MFREWVRTPFDNFGCITPRKIPRRRGARRDYICKVAERAHQINSIDLFVYFESVGDAGDYRGTVKGKVLIGMEMLGIGAFHVFVCT